MVAEAFESWQGALVKRMPKIGFPWFDMLPFVWSFSKIAGCELSGTGLGSTYIESGERLHALSQAPTCDEMPHNHKRCIQLDPLAVQDAGRTSLVISDCGQRCKRTGITSGALPPTRERCARYE